MNVPRGAPTVILLLLIAGAIAFWGWSIGAQHSPPPAAAQSAVVTAKTDVSQLRVMTANVRISEPDDGLNAWPNRRELLIKTLLKYDPDIIGCQEVSPAQGAYMIKELAAWYTHYPRAGVGTIEGDTGSRTSQLIGQVTASFASLNTLFYRTDRFNQLDGLAGLVLPDQPQSNPSENTFFTLAVLKQKADGKVLIVVDTHIRHQQAFAVKCAVKLREILAATLKKYPAADILMMGDINHDRTSPVYSAIVGVTGAADGLGILSDTFDYSLKRPNESWGNWHAFTGRAERTLPSDLIFTTSGWKPTDTTLIRDGGENGVWPSDHFFVLATLHRL